ncbi:MAG: hypothetical protein U9R69_00840 [Thermodesulfobacteriota bacterium]|nr:hypothetical protein [Thermodesulfobacteriota bacterium]
MANIDGYSMKKVTFNMPTELKIRVKALKEELQVSLSSIYNEAIINYLKEKEAEKWQQGVSMALKDKRYKELSEELGRDNGDFHDY